MSEQNKGDNIALEITNDKLVDVLMHAATREDLRTTREDLRAEIGKVDQRIDETRTELVQRIDETRTELVQRIDETRTELVQRIDETRTELVQRIDETRTELVQRMDKHFSQLVTFVVIGILVPIALQFLK